MAADSFYSMKTKTLGGKDVELSDYKGKVALVVNTASECGYTPQYKGLEKLYTSMKDKGFVILGFPSNDFGGQEPGSDKEIAEFCEINYGVTFPMFTKSKVVGDDKSEIYKFLTSHSPQPGEVKWNFEKFVIDKNGKVVGRFKSATTPDSKELKSALEELL